MTVVVAVALVVVFGATNLAPRSTCRHSRVNTPGCEVTRMKSEPEPTASVDLYWLPLGAGADVVRWNGRVYEAAVALRQHRDACDLYHAALQVQLDGDRFVIEMAPVWDRNEPDRGVVAEGAVGLPWLGRSRWFRYEVRRWRNGTIPDIAYAVDSPRRLSANRAQARQVLDLAPTFPTVTWGRDELRTGDMWNSNSLIAWLLARSGHDTDAAQPPTRGRAPGWSAGLAVAARQAASQPAQATVHEGATSIRPHRRRPATSATVPVRGGPRPEPVRGRTADRVQPCRPVPDDVGQFTVKTPPRW